MYTLLQDLRYTIRVLRNKPGFTFVILITLSLGIGANTAIFSVIDAVLLQPLPYQNSENLILARYVEKKTGIRVERASYQDFLDWRAQNHIFEDVATFTPSRDLLITSKGAEHIPAAQVSSNFFQMLGINTFKGRIFLAEEERGNSENVILISHALWQRTFGADEQLIGRRIRLGDQSFTVVGILPADFKFPFYLEKADLWKTNAVLPAEMRADRAVRNLRVIARLRNGVSLQDAQRGLTVIASRLEQENPATNRELDISIDRVQDELTKEVRGTLWLLFGAVGFVLLIACSNVANLLLAQAISRSKEIGIRIALGATTRHIMRQSFLESLLLSLTGGALGVIVAAWGIRLILNFSPQNLPHLNPVSINSHVLFFTLATSIFTAFCFGLAPAFKATGTSINEALKNGSHISIVPGNGNGLRAGFIIGEIGITFILLVGAGLLVSSYIKLNRVSLGFNPENVLTAELSFPPNKYIKAEQRATFIRQMLVSMKSLPGVKSVGFASSSPFSGMSMTSSFGIVGYSQATNGTPLTAEIITATPDYFTTMGVQVLAGRYFTESDDKRTKGVTIINETFAQRYFPNRNPLGQSITLYTNRDEDSPTEFEIIGILHSVRGAALDREPTPEIYAPYSQMSWTFGQLVIGTEASPSSLVNAIRHQIKEIDPEIPFSTPIMVENMIAESIAPQRFNLFILNVFAVMGLILMLVGIYSVMSYFVYESMHHIGIRIALGAQSSDVLKFVLKRGAAITVAGISIGIAGALCLTRLMTSSLYGVTATDPVTFLTVLGLLTFVSLFACYIPALGGTKVDPISILRSQ